jgi:hypothetical protein
MSLLFQHKAPCWQSSCHSYIWATFPQLERFWITPWSRVLVEKLIVTQLVKKFTVFYGIRRFVAVFTRDHRVTFRNKLLSYNELPASRPTPKPEDHPLLAACKCLFNTFEATLHIWRPSPSPTTPGSSMLWWQDPLKTVTFLHGSDPYSARIAHPKERLRNDSNMRLGSRSFGYCISSSFMGRPTDTFRYSTVHKVWWNE